MDLSHEVDEDRNARGACKKKRNHQQKDTLHFIMLVGNLFKPKNSYISTLVRPGIDTCNNTWNIYRERDTVKERKRVKEREREYVILRVFRP